VVLFLFLTHFAIGIIFTLALVSREAGVKFFRFNAGLAATLIAVAFAFRTGDAGATTVTRLALGSLVVTEAAVVLYWATVGRALASIRPAIVSVACVGGILTLVLQAIEVTSGWSATTTALTMASFLTSAALLGGTCTAMILGHWYLVIPSMKVSYLQSMVKLHIVSLVLRVAVVAAAIIVAVMTWQPGLGPSFRHYVQSLDGIFFWMRVLFGLAGPAVLAWLTWETAKIQSTQSATGILYVDLFTVVVGELLAKAVLLATRVPV
jgi:protein NrfD